ncbi:MAG: hypothetical protein QNK20_14950 [Aureibaculum sp.]|nr:hypothetical protein [Aureibaculum sp.]
MENKKTHWKKLENPDYIGAYSLENGKDLIVTIDSVKRELVTGQGGKKEECTVAYLKGSKPFILNRTNMKTIQKIYDTPYIEDWAGKTLTLYISKIKAFGEDNVECLRVRPTAPIKAEFTPQSAKWKGAIQAIKEGNFSIDELKKSFNISPANEKLLKDAI